MMKIQQYFSQAQIEQIRDGAAEILSKIGVRVPRQDLRATLQKKGCVVKDEFVLFTPKQVYDKIDAQYFVASPPEKQRPLRTYASAYSNNYENLQGSYEAITNAGNVAMGQFVQKASKIWKGLGPNCPGHPQDVHPELQFMRHAVNSYVWCENYSSMEPVSAKIASYHLDLNEAMGKPAEGLPVYMASPLTIAGESLDIVLANAHRLKSAWVCSMPSLGANAPLNLIAAYAQTAAENIGGALVIELATGLHTGFATNLFTFDFYAMSMPFGTPEKLLLEWMNNEVAARISGRESGYVYMTDIHTNALRCSMQACAEKASLAMAGALHGAQVFNCSGTLGMDELFSPVQLLLDLEMLEHIERIVDGMPVEDFEGDLLQEVKEGVEKGYIGTDRTLDNMDAYVWRSKFYNRQSFGGHLKVPVKMEIEKAREMAEKLMAQPVEWRLDSTLEKEAEKIYAKAEKALQG